MTPARPEVLPEFLVLRIEVAFRLLFGIQVIEVPEELVEAVVRRQVLVTLAQVILAELAGRITLGLHDVGDGGHPVPYAVRVAGHADRQQPHAELFLAENEGCALRCSSAAHRHR